MEILDQVIALIAEILDLEVQEIAGNSYVIRDLDAESIDLLELSVAISRRFSIEVNDDALYLHRFGEFLTEAQEGAEDPIAILANRYSHLTRDRIATILKERGDGPALKVEDLVSYISWKLGPNHESA